MIQSSATEVIFENPEHDFPQRVIYRLQPDGLLVGRIEGISKGKPRAIDFPMKRVPCGMQCEVTAVRRRVLQSLAGDLPIGDVRVAYDVTESTLPWRSRPPRLLSGASVTRRMRLP